MRTIALSLLLLLMTPSVGRAEGFPSRPRVVVVKTILIAPFERAEAAIVRSLQKSMDVWVVPVVPGNPNEPARIAKLEPDVVVSIGSQATKWASEAIVSVPIVFSMVLDPVSSGLVSSMQRPGGRITGAALDIPLMKQFTAMRDLLKARRVGVLFNPSTSGGVIRSAEKIAKTVGLQVIAIPVSDPTGFGEALKKIDNSFDAVWSVPDKVVFAKAFSQRILLHTIRRRIPLMGFSEQHVQAGALFALVTSHEENGVQAADRVRRIVRGEAAGRIPVGIPKKLEIVFNARTAESLGVKVSQISLARVRPVR